MDNADQNWIRAIVEDMTALDSPVVSMAEAARYLRVNPSTLRCWIDAGTRLGKAYRPVIRLEPTGSSRVTSVEFVHRVDWDGGTPTRWHLCADADSPVAIDPQLRGGRPSVEGVSAQAIWELAESGEDASASADEYGIPEKSVRRGLSYEHGQRAA